MIGPKGGFVQTPATKETSWIFPKGYPSKVPHSNGTVYQDHKAHTPLARYVNNLNGKAHWFFPGVAEGDAAAWKKVRDYYSFVLRRPWEKGKKLVIASEEFDRVMGYSVRQCLKDVSSDNGEDTYVAPCSGTIIDRILDLLPFGVGDSTIHNIAPLRHEDIEVQLNYRLPRLDNMASVWHEAKKWAEEGKWPTLRHFLVNGPQETVHDSFGMALQFLRRGLRTSIVDMKGVHEREAETSLAEREPRNGNGTVQIIGGTVGVVACDVLRLGRGATGLCDERGRLRLPPGTEVPESANRREDKDRADLGLTEDQAARIERLLRAYDCGVLRHLRKYRERGLFRILHPSRDLLGECAKGRDGRDVSLRDTMQEMRRIASEDERR